MTFEQYDALTEAQRGEWDALNRAAFVLALEAEDAAKTSRDFGRGLAHAARLIAEMRDAVGGAA